MTSERVLVTKNVLDRNSDPTMYVLLWEFQGRPNGREVVLQRAKYRIISPRYR